MRCGKYADPPCGGEPARFYRSVVRGHGPVIVKCEEHRLTSRFWLSMEVGEAEAAVLEVMES